MQSFCVVLCIFSLSPYSYDSQASADGNIAATQDFVPLGAITLFASSSADYQEHINATVCRANATYHEFLNSAEGKGFTGQVSWLCVCAYARMCVYECV